MKITSVTVEYGLTENLGDYNNVRPSVRLTADVEEGEDVDDVFQELWERAEGEVKEGVNQALEAHGRPALYHEGPRYDVFRADGKVFIVPAQVELGREVERWLGWRPAERGHRPGYVLELAERLADERREELVNCAGGDLRPVVEAYQEYEKQRAAEEAERERRRQESFAAIRDGERGLDAFDPYEPESGDDFDEDYDEDPGL